VKYSPDDTTITVAATVDEDCVILSVTDQGTGLSGDETSSLFRRLYRGSNARHAGIPGSGLGLGLVRAILDRHHGTITLTPNKPSGAQATIRLPRTGSMNGAGTTTEP
jgi:signal transduction histidine kinase